MTGEKSRQLKVGDKVYWQNDQADQEHRDRQELVGIDHQMEQPRRAECPAQRYGSNLPRSKNMNCFAKWIARKIVPDFVFKPAPSSDVVYRDISFFRRPAETELIQGLWIATATPAS